MAAVAAMAVALALGPVQLVARAILRAFGGKPLVNSWQNAATLGLAAGLLAGPLVAGAILGGDASVTAALLGLAFLLLVQDLAWRWLPLEWTLPLLFLGLSAGFLGGQISDTLLGAFVGAGLLWSLQIVFRFWRGVDALGTGDIWLAAGLGCFAGPATIAWVLGLAAVSGLVEEIVRRTTRTTQARNRWGVAFGAHVIAVFLIVSAF